MDSCQIIKNSFVGVSKNDENMGIANIFIHRVSSMVDNENIKISSFSFVNIYLIHMKI